MGYDAFMANGATNHKELTMRNKVDYFGQVTRTNSRGNDKVIGQIHRSPAGRFKVVMVGTAVARSVCSLGVAQGIAEGWQPTDPTTEDILHRILEGN
jgi:hypothetical protein